MSNKLVYTAKKLIEKYNDKKIKCIYLRTPFPEKVSLDSINLSNELKEFILKYEPCISSSGLYKHQAEVLEKIRQKDKDFLLTTGTGSGKSLAFLTWVVDRLLNNSNATGMITFPSQALLYSQADRLAIISENVKCVDDANLSGTMYLKGKSITWSVWKGSTDDKIMREHIKTDEFRSARLRLATIDVGHWNLLNIKEKSNKKVNETERFVSSANSIHSSLAYNFLINLDCMVMDESHSYDSIFGANVNCYLKRIRSTLELLGYKRPSFFMASATLKNAVSFARDLIDVQEKDIIHIIDSTKPIMEEIDPVDGLKKLENPNFNCLSRICYIIPEVYDFSEFMFDDSNFDSLVNTLYFVNNKFYGKIFKRMMSQARSNTDLHTYDADLLPKERRTIERHINSLAKSQVDKGITLVGTNALELGIDIEGLDICIMDDVPPSSINILQRMGRVGRKEKQPGLILLGLSSRPKDERLYNDPIKELSYENISILSIPKDVEIIRKKHLYLHKIQEAKISKSYEDYSSIISSIFKDRTSEKVLEKDLYNELGFTDSTILRNWLKEGFRGSSNRKIPVKEKLEGQKNAKAIVQVENQNILRDFHPYALYPGHYGDLYQVIGYEPNDIDNCASVRAVIVRKRKKNKYIVTRGILSSSAVKIHNLNHPLIKNLEMSSKDRVFYGKFNYSQHLEAYMLYIYYNDGSITSKKMEIDYEYINRYKFFADKFNTREKIKEALKVSYITNGIEWHHRIDFKQYDKNNTELIKITSDVLCAFLAMELECNSSELVVILEEKMLKILDYNKGGSGLSYELLTRRALIRDAIKEAIERLSKDDASDYINDLYNNKIKFLKINKVISILNILLLEWTSFWQKDTSNVVDGRKIITRRKVSP
jgi:superfamily II DNA/RNA helicase